MEADLVLWIVVSTALVFAFTNGVHDTANAVATSVSTRAMRPRAAIGLSAALNFAGAFLSLEVAATIAEDVVDAQLITPAVVFAGLVGAIAWNLATWWFGLPTSSSHALIGGVIGAALLAGGRDAVKGDELLGVVVVPAVIAPVLALVVAACSMFVINRIAGRARPAPAIRGFRLGQIVSSALYSLSHGTNDAQKAMGVIVLALAAHGTMAPGDDVPGWVVVAAAAALALGTLVGGWRIIRTLGSRIIAMDTSQGFAAQSSGATVILAASHAGLPLSTTQVMAGSVTGAGAARRLSAVRWGVAGNIVIAWCLTLPAAAIVGAVTYAVVHALGADGPGPLVVTGLLLLGAAAALFRRLPLDAGAARRF